MNIEQIKEVLEGKLEIGGEPIEILNTPIHNLSDLRTILALHEEIEQLRSKANAWDKVWGELRKTKLVTDISFEHAKHGNASAASILLDAFDMLMEQSK